MILFQELRCDVIGICANPARPIVDSIEVLKKFDNAENLLHISTEAVDNQYVVFCQSGEKVAAIRFCCRTNKTNVNEYSSWHPNGCTIKGLEVLYQLMSLVVR